MPEIDMTCAVCGGTWGKPDMLPGVNEWLCPADCHDEAKWKALAELEQQMSKYKARVEWLERKNGGWL